TDDDFKGSSVPLPETDYPEIVSVRTVKGAPHAVRFFPNPATNEITIDLNGVSSVDVAIFDLQGKQVMTSNLTDNGSLNIGSLTPGVYMIKSSNQGAEIGYFRMIKQ
ncbi:MAG: T9SS type A sorting domain-containing protein, partial [Bacteroidia bacterium]|nr:T9SS type A sorting domain-containing protein [Bacteroidia bacterium]